MNKKKTFTDNPAMEFITAPVEDNLQDPTPKEIAEARAAGIPEGFKVNPIFVERKTKRANLTFTPTVFDLAKKKAKAKGISFNEYVNNVIALDVYTE